MAKRVAYTTPRRHGRGGRRCPIPETANHPAAPTAQEWARGPFTVGTDCRQLDLELIHRGRGLASWLTECVLSHPDLRAVHRFLLVTHDPRLCLRSGFRPLRDPSEYMERVASGG